MQMSCGSSAESCSKAPDLTPSCGPRLGLLGAGGVLQAQGSWGEGLALPLGLWRG